MPDNNAKPVSVKLDAEIRARIDNLAQVRQRTAHWLMREAIQQYIEREEKREAMRQDVIKAWNEFQETGLHVPEEEVDTWLASWGTESELPTPKCRK